MRKWLTWWHRAQSSDLSEVTDQGGSSLGITLTLVNYNQDEAIGIENISPADCPTYLKTGLFTWIHVQGQPKPSLLRELGELFSLHPLALEDAINIGERSKAEVYDNQIVVILGMPIKRGLKIVNEQITLFLGENYLISISNGTDDPFKAVRRRLESPRSLLRQRGIDYLLYVLVDVIIDHSFPFLEEFQEEIEAVEDELQGKESVSTFKTLYYIKRELLIFRLKLRPQRETVRVLMRDDSGLLSEETKIYLRDCNDHMIRIIDIIEIYHDLITNMLDVHLTLANEVQRKATAISVLLGTVTFITGIYGMNLVIPESNWRLGYPFALGIMAIAATGLVLFFKRKRWL